MTIILGEKTYRGKLVESRADAALSSIRNSEILIGYQVRRYHHPQLQWAVVVEIPEHNEDRPQAHEVLALLVEAARSAGSGKFVVRGFEHGVADDLWSFDPAMVQHFQATLIWGLPLEIRVRSVRTPPVVRVNWPWITDFLRENALGIIGPEKVIYSTPAVCILEHLRELIQYGGQKIECLYDEE